jgi:hypothetical protein
MVENIMDKKLKLFFTISIVINILLAGVILGGVYFHNTIMDNNNMPKLVGKFKKHHKENKKIAKQCVCARKRLRLAMTDENFNEEKFNLILKEFVDCNASFTKKVFEKEKEFYLTLDASEKELYRIAGDKRRKLKKLIKCNK